MDAPLRPQPRIGGRFIAWVDEIIGRARRRRLEEELVRSDAEIARLRHLLADATRPPTQFARLHEREVAVRRLTRLQIARPARAGALAHQLTGTSTDRTEHL